MKTPRAAARGTKSNDRSLPHCYRAVNLHESCLALVSSLVCVSVLFDVAAGTKYKHLVCATIVFSMASCSLLKEHAYRLAVWIMFVVLLCCIEQGPLEGKTPDLVDGLLYCSASSSSSNNSSIVARRTVSALSVDHNL